ncbi:oxidoreductase [Deinococcus alpinitundrae]|uniref:oxidoreductase n=1 Tax=Deinococcus alpinitundrae TaxID=468913 RepID=UPI00137A1C14|nr:oxidoreductase [Deinococcus alpinitundrae]
MPFPTWNSLTTAQKAAIVAAGTVQAGLFAAAWTDLSGRPEARLHGRKVVWRAALFVNFVGPLAYFAAGRQKSDWSEADIPDQSGRIAIVTGANSGLGYETARALAQRGATVIMACRSAQKANRAAEAIRALQPAGSVTVMELDLGDLNSVRSFADQFKTKYQRLDLLINNAGIMVPPQGQTEQGFEVQFGVNHLAHFALTAQLMPLLNATPGARVVSVSSTAHRFGHLDFADLNWRHRTYNAWQAYGQSKLANLLFIYELQRKLAAANESTLAVAAHPGYAATGLQGEGGGMQLANRLFAQTQAMGALPTLYAATAPQVRGGQYFGPSGLAELGGAPEQVESNARSHNESDAQRLWQVSEELSGVQFDL